MEVDCVSVEEALSFMQQAVKRGALNDAALHGEQCVRPLSLSSQQVTFGPLLSTGAESRVFEGSYESLSVAIKQPIIRTTLDLDRFRKELKFLARLNHPFIVPLLGARMLPPNYYLVMPLDQESYYDAIHHRSYRPSWREVMEVGCQLSSAMQHVHEHGIIHRDLKTRNVLRGTDNRIRLIDFGIAEEMESEMQCFHSPSGGFHKRQLMGTLEYMAPEVLQNKGHSCASDVYAFAVTLNEIATGVYPFSDCNKDNPDAHTVLEMGYGRQELATAVVAEGLRPTLPPNCPSIFSELMQRCWMLDPSSRPSFEQLHQRFSRILSNFDALQIPPSITTMKAKSLVTVPCAPQTFVKKQNADGLGNGSWLEDSCEDSYACHLTCGAFATAGYRGEDRMEDRHVLETPFLGRDSAALLGVFDGHRGSEAAQFAVDHFTEILIDKSWKSSDAEEAFESSFIDLESRFEATVSAEIEEARGTRYPGCTALAALVLKNKLFIANAGDCRAVLCRDGAAYQLSRDHTAMDVLERTRIQKIGSASVRWQKGSWRIGNAGIQVTRSLGDVDLKSSGVCPNAEVTSFTLTSADSFLIIASDGLWDTVTNEDAVRLVHDTVKHPDMCAKRLATEALTCGSQDNITVIVAFLKPVDTLEQIYINGRSKYTKPATSSCFKLPQIAVDEMRETL